MTEPAVIKMLTLSRDQNESRESVLQKLNIVPLVIAYELDPCDELKAAELSAGRRIPKLNLRMWHQCLSGLWGKRAACICILEIRWTLTRRRRCGECYRPADGRLTIVCIEPMSGLGSGFMASRCPIL